MLPNYESASLSGMQFTDIDQNIKGGEFYGPHMGLRGYPVKVKSVRTSHNREYAKKLWKISEDITGVKIDLQKS